MKNDTIYLPTYTIGENIYTKISDVCPRGSAVIIGGKNALAAAEKRIRSNLGSMTADTLWYGGECSDENVEMLAAQSAVRRADMIFAVGGGKALDTCKVLGEVLDKPVYAFPTTASTCAATTAVSILYKPDGAFLRPHFLIRPPVHTFIDTSVIAAAPARYLWAGMGDTIAKHYESTVSGRGEVLNHSIELGMTVSRMCVDPVLRWGEKALSDNRAGIASPALEQVALATIVTTGIASILLCAEHTIDYNTGLAHAIFYALTSFPQIEERHLHGEVVGFGVLILLLADGQEDAFRKLFRFMKSVGLPTSPHDIELTREDVEKVIPMAAAMKDVAHNPYAITPALLTDAFNRLCAYREQ